MNFTFRASVWIGNPALVTLLNPEDPADFHLRTTIFREDFDASTIDYLKLGTADINYTVDLTDPEIKKAALAAIDEKIRSEMAESERRLQALRAAAESLLAIEYKA